MAPELVNKTEGYSLEIDIWALGVIIYMMLVGKPPFHSDQPDKTYKNITDVRYEFPENVELSDQAKNLVTMCLFRNPSKRPKLEKLLGHKFFTMNKFPRYLHIDARNRAPNDKYLLIYMPNLASHIQKKNVEAAREEALLLQKDSKDGKMEKERIRKLKNGGGLVAVQNRLHHDQQLEEVKSIASKGRGLDSPMSSRRRASMNAGQQNLLLPKPQKLPPINTDDKGLLCLSSRKMQNSQSAPNFQGPLMPKRSMSNINEKTPVPAQN